MSAKKPENGVAGATKASGVLFLLASAQFLMTVDATVMNVSIPSLVEDLDTDVASIQGVITAYTLVMAAAMLTGAKLGDILGRRRAFRIGLVVYGCGSAVTAVSPNVTVLLLGWSLLEGLGAALVMPTVTALIAGSFTGQKRAKAYGTIAAAAAVAVAAGPIVGGFVTTRWSWRWVFVAEVFIVILLLIGSRRLSPAEQGREVPQLDLVGAVLSAAGMTLVVFGVLQSARWGLLIPNVTSGDAATPAIGGISLSAWLIGLGLTVLWLFTMWLHRRERVGQEPLVATALFSNSQLKGGLTLLSAQFLISQGVFFAVPLFLTLVVGLSSFQTGLRMLPLSVALIIVAPGVSKWWPNVSPRRLVRVGLLTMAASTALLGVLLGQSGADAGIVLVPFALLGAGLGLLASQLGNVIVSSEPEERSSEVGGLQYTAQNLGATLGTAIVGAVVIGSLSSLLLAGVTDSTVLDDSLKETAAVELQGGADFVSDESLSQALAETDLSEAEQQEVLDVNSSARIRALQLAMVVVTFVALAALFATGRVPSDPLTSPDDAKEKTT